MFDFLSPKESEPVETAEKKAKSISDFYTRAEIREKFGVKDSWIYKVVAENNVPKKLFKFDSIKFLWQPNQSFLQRPLLILHNCVKGDGTNQAMRKFSRLPI